MINQEWTGDRTQVLPTSCLSIFRWCDFGAGSGGESRNIECELHLHRHYDTQGQSLRRIGACLTKYVYK